MPSVAELFKLESSLRALSLEKCGGARLLPLSQVATSLSKLYSKGFLPKAWRSLESAESSEMALCRMTGCMSEKGNSELQLDYKKLITCVLFGLFPRVPTADDLVKLAKHFVAADHSRAGVSSQNDFASAELWFEAEMEGTLVLELKRFLWNMWSTGSGLVDYRGMVSQCHAFLRLPSPLIQTQKTNFGHAALLVLPGPAAAATVIPTSRRWTSQSVRGRGHLWAKW